MRAEARTFFICRQVKLVFLVMIVTGVVIIGHVDNYAVFDTSTMSFVDTFSIVTVLTTMVLDTSAMC